MNRVPQLEHVDSIYTGIDDSTKRFYQNVTVEYMRDYIVYGEIVDNRRRKRVDKLFVERMPIGDDEIYTGSIYVKYPHSDRRVEKLHEGFVYYSQFDVSVPRCAFDDLCVIMEGVSGNVVMDEDSTEKEIFNGIVADGAVLDSLLSDIALFVVSGHMDYGLQNIIVSENEYHFIEFETYGIFHNPFKMLTHLPYYFTRSIDLRHPYAVVTTRAYDIAWWLLIHEDELYTPHQVINNCYQILLEYPIGNMEFICSEKDAWDVRDLVVCPYQN